MTSTAPHDPHRPPPTQWTSTAYQSAAGYVPQLTTKLLQLLAPQSTDRILDVGCGDGAFTAKFVPLVSSVFGVDASASFVDTANADLAKTGKFEAKVVDCRFLDREIASNGDLAGKFDKVVSNAALHWILRDENTRLNTLRGCFAALKPGGVFAFEMGGAGNCAEVNVALVSALLHHTSCTLEEAIATSPWFFPDVKEMEGLLREAGFVIEENDGLELQYRPTRMEETADGRPDLEGWIRLMGRQFLDRAEQDGKLEEVVKEVVGVVSMMGVTGRADGRGEFGYVRLRGVAKRPVE